MRGILLIVIGLVLAAHAVPETRLALVIDQTNYRNSGELSRVALARSEADLIEAALTETGFNVTRVSDQTKSQLVDSLDEFRIRLEQSGAQAIGFVYYTGHGAQHPQNKSSYLLGTDARLRAASDLGSYGVSLEDQRDSFALTGAKAVFLVFDACRNVATGAGFKTATKGISRVEAEADMLIAYSTGIDDVAQEGIYAPVLAEEIRRPGQSAVSVFDNVQQRVATATNRKQRPWFNPQLYNKVCFADCDSDAAGQISAKLLPSSGLIDPGQATASKPAAEQEWVSPFANCPECPALSLRELKNGQKVWASAVVTQQSWKHYCEESGCNEDESKVAGTKPVTSINWKRANQYVSWLATKTMTRIRLPTAAELEDLQVKPSSESATSFTEWTGTCHASDSSQTCAHYEVRGWTSDGQRVKNWYSSASKGSSLGFRVIAD